MHKREKAQIKTRNYISARANHFFFFFLLFSLFICLGLIHYGQGSEMMVWVTLRVSVCENIQNPTKPHLENVL